MTLLHHLIRHLSFCDNLFCYFYKETDFLPKMSPMNFQECFIRQALSRLELSKKAAEAAIAQIPEKSLFIQPAEGSNSLAVIMQHMTGNMLSRWTDFLVSDGEKSWRNREDEFVVQSTDFPLIMDRWQLGWDCFFNALHELTLSDLNIKITIRGEAHYVYDAILRQIMHYSQHIGQIIYLAKMLAGKQWQSLTIPMGESENYKAKERPSHKGTGTSN